ncbi:MAG: UDP-N-acetylmuramate dehydrogenase [Verrucomicrobiales bacterium]|jgi:UDP-N-acetylmuramate dehydrogenase
MSRTAEEEAAATALAAALSEIDGATVERSVSAGLLCTYRVGGPIDILLRVETREALAAAVGALHDHNAPVLTVGKGSNLLVADAGFHGVGVVLGEAFTTIEIDGTNAIAGGAAALPVVARATVNAGLDGFAWAVGVPGSIGGAVRMNAGGHGSDMAASLVSVDVADLTIGGIVTRSAGSLDLSYRHSSIAPWQIVASARLVLAEGDIDSGAELLREIVAWRREHQPGGANAGSVFTNPPSDSAGRLIDASGLKGYRIGSAEVSTKHANFIQADPDGSANDVIALMVHVVEQVKNDVGIHLHAETRLVGFDDDLVDRVQGSPTTREETSDG